MFTRPSMDSGHESGCSGVQEGPSAACTLGPVVPSLISRADRPGIGYPGVYSTAHIALLY